MGFFSDFFFILRYRKWRRYISVQVMSWTLIWSTFLTPYVKTISILLVGHRLKTQTLPWSINQ